MDLEAQEFNIFNINFFENINSYKSNLTISQVIKFFEKYGITIPKTTIQNLVRNEVITEIYEKRYYTKIHLFEIILTQYYKDVFSLKELKNLNRIIEKECDINGIDKVFENIYVLNNNINEYLETDTYLDLIYSMTSSVLNRKRAVYFLESW